MHTHEKNLYTKRTCTCFLRLVVFHFFFTRSDMKACVCVFLLNRVQRITKCETHLTIHKSGSLYSNASICVWIEAQDWQRRRSVFNIRKVVWALRFHFNSPIHSGRRRRSIKLSLSAMQNLLLYNRKKKKSRMAETKDKKNVFIIQLNLPIGCSAHFRLDA